VSLIGNEMSKTFWDSMNDRSKRNWKQIVDDIKGVPLVLRDKPDLESLDEIAEIMKTAPGFEKEEK